MSFTNTTRLSLALHLILSTCSYALATTAQKPSVSVIHDNEYSYTLKVSPGKGIGVFVLHDIPAGAPVFSHWAKFKMRIYNRNEIPSKFVEHCIHLKDNKELGPERFDQMPIFWYLNHSEDSANLILPEGFSIVDDEWCILKFYARRDIKAGEELLCNYNELGEPEDSKEDFYRKPDHNKN